VVQFSVREWGCLHGQVPQEGYEMRRLILTLGILAISLSAYGAPVNMEFIGFQQVSPLGDWTLGYPYLVTVNGGPIVYVMCDDWVHGGFPGQTWQANFTNLGTQDLSLLRFNQLNNALTLYDEAGWLLLQTPYKSQSVRMDINWAVWHIFYSSVPLTTSQMGWLMQAQTEAQNGFPGVDFYGVGVYTPVNQHDPNPENAQEFLTTVPEPGTLILLCSALAGVVAYKRPR